MKTAQTVTSKGGVIPSDFCAFIQVVLEMWSNVNWTDCHKTNCAMIDRKAKPESWIYSDWESKLQTPHSISQLFKKDDMTETNLPSASHCLAHDEH